MNEPVVSVPIKVSLLAQPGFKTNPYPFYARMRAENPVFQVSVPFVGRSFVVTRYDDVVTVGKDEARTGRATRPFFLTTEARGGRSLLRRKVVSLPA